MQIMAYLEATAALERPRSVLQQSNLIFNSPSLMSLTSACYPQNTVKGVGRKPS